MILYHHLIKFFNEKQLKCENFNLNLFYKQFNPKTHQQILLIKDIENLTFEGEVVSAIWILFIKKDEILCLFNYIQEQINKLKQLHPRFKKFKNIKQPF